MTVTTPTIVVGVDGSDSSRQALDWAVEEATRRHLPLQVLCAWQSDYSEKTVAPVTRRIEEASGAIVEAAAAHARTESPGLEVATEHRARPGGVRTHRRIPTRRHRRRRRPRRGRADRSPARVNVDAARGLRLLPRGRGAGGRRPARRRTTRVVVGVDGSDLSTEATGYAFEQASERGLGLTVLHAWNANVYTSGVAMTALSPNRGTSSRPSRSGSPPRRSPDGLRSSRTSTCGPSDPGPTGRRPRGRLGGRRARRRGQPRTGRLPRPAPRVGQPQRPAPGALPGRRRPTLLTRRLRRLRRHATSTDHDTVRRSGPEPWRAHDRNPPTPTRRRRRRRLPDRRAGRALGGPGGLDPSHTDPPRQRLEPQLRHRDPGSGGAHRGGALPGHPGRRPERHRRRRPRHRGHEYDLHRARHDRSRRGVTARRHRRGGIPRPPSVPGVPPGSHVVGGRGARRLSRGGRPRTSRCPTGRVVVGVDGTPRSSDAVAYAFAFASAHDLGPDRAARLPGGVRRRRHLRAVTAEDSNTRLAQEELALTSETVAGWGEKYPDVHVETTTVHDHPVDALVKASTTADLVVLGGRRRGPIGGPLLGSVGHGVLHDAHCPVAVARSSVTHA